MNLLPRTLLPIIAFQVSCSSKPPREARAPVSEAPQTSVSEQQQPEVSPTQSSVAIAEDIRKACAITESEAHFAYDSSRVHDRDRAILKRLAECFTSGPLAGREMRLVGHADPRGDEEYNYLLGQRRADNVKSTIVALGMPGERVSTTSRGENEAVGTDEPGWIRDRRVDVMLGT